MIVVTVARKPLSESSVAANVLKHGTGSLNIDASRIAHANANDLAQHRAMVDAIKAKGGSMGNSWKNSSDLAQANDVASGGRWPANLILQHLPGCQCLGTRRVTATSIHGSSTATRRSGVHAEAGGHQTVGREQPVRGYADADGLEAVAAWACEPGCPVAHLDATTSANVTGNRSPTSQAAVVEGTDNHTRSGREYPNETGTVSRFFKQVKS